MNNYYKNRLKNREKTSLGIYVHVPFCDSKCPYCDFYSISADNDLKKQYFEALIMQIKEYAPQAKNCKVDSIFFGGGTPSSVPPKLISNVLKTIKNSFKVTSDAEISIEANPGSAKYRSLKAFRRAGFNRLSLGLQSIHGEELKTLGRAHSPKDFLDSMAGAKKAKLKNINVDLMCAFPGQSIESFKHTLSEVIGQEPSHISCYTLKIEDGTPFGMNRESLLMPSEELDRELYHLMVETLSEAGYNQYEISNFAKEGMQCRHNLRYWNCEEYLGFGASAHSYFVGKRFSFVSNIKDFISIQKSGGKMVCDLFDIPYSERIGEYLMLRLRLNEGINLEAFRKRFGLSFEEIFSRQIEKYLKSGHLEKNSSGYNLTLPGFDVSNTIISDFLDFTLPLKIDKTLVKI